MANLTAEIHSYADAEEFLGNKRTRKLGNNTYVERPDYATEIIGVRLHATAIVTYHADGRIILDTGGWNTPTTRDRLHSLVPVGVSVGSGKCDRRGAAEDLIVIAYQDVDTGERSAWGWPILEREVNASVVADSRVVITTDPETGEVLSIEGDRK